MEPPQDPNHKKMIKLTSKIGEYALKRSFLKSIEWTQNIRFSQKTKSTSRTKNCRVKEKDKSVRIEKNKDSRTQ